ncbi:hypothetical protein CRE_24645 [Caenorhabditis remanei]|uniref:Uncharacterized protein n=1 Tax=Caenorhabditis remanei TaxID=31234 RepID=E3N3V1_CAERE|nr:hypothetical protein CRE_24645 [Caenorhabditis remanei]
MGILPKDARDICESFGGKIATNTKENQKHLEEEILKNCDIKSSFWPKFCIWEDLNEKREDLEFQMNQGVLMTHPIHLGDMLHLKLEIEPNTLEVVQISDSILEDIPINNIQNVILQLAIHNDYNNGIDTKPEYKMVTVGRGTIKKLEKAFEVSQKSIPVYSCRKASYVACDVISAIPTTTELPATRKIRKKTSTVESETVENAETTSSKPQGSSYLHSEFLDEHIMFFVSLSGISVAMLVGSLVLQIMKMWQNRKLRVAKKKKNK